MINRVLVLAPHTDDGEFGCGGTIAKFTAEKKEVFYAAFSTAQKSVPRGFRPDILKEEVRQATSVLGISPANLLIYDFPVREFPACRQEILETMIYLKRNLRPDTVLLPSCHDLHQDHRTVAVEGIRAFKHANILGYEEPWNNLQFRPGCFVALSERDLRKKLEAVACYKSQSHRTYAGEAFIRGWAKMRGAQANTPYAEGFEVIRFFIK